MTLYEAVVTFLTALISTIGAFVPIFILMCIHFLFRKRAYNAKRERLFKLKEAQEMINKINGDAIESIYKSVSVDNLKDFIDKSGTLGANRWEAVSLIQNYLNEFRKGQESVLEMMLEISYLDEYGFMTYIGTLLNRHFPDKKN